uniref:uncharacterized protein LOC109956790 n=1 Tax=Monopterus albus TaxID=43700 RepID=UPI0009B410F8|nr:uncharacterized protein LOC109956790 [Monopterus albus]
MNMWMAGIIFAVSVGLSETKNLTGKAGESITLNTGVTGLRGNYQVLWSYGVDQRVIINFDNGKLEWNESQRFQLDERTGSLTILSLHINDSGQYQGQIINGNGSQQTFNLTVVGECLEACGEANPKNVCVCMELHAEKLETDSIKRTFADSCELFKITSNVVLLRLVHFERYKAAGRVTAHSILVGYAVNLVASCQKDALVRYSSGYPDFLEEVMFYRAFKVARSKSLQPGQEGEALVGFWDFKVDTLQSLYESEDPQKSGSY